MKKNWKKIPALALSVSMALAPMTVWAENETGAKTQERLESKVSVTENDESNGTVTGVSVVDGTDG